MKRKKVVLGFSLLAGVTAMCLLISCQWPYSPEPNTVKSLSGGTANIKSINTGAQICNPSISQDTVNFKGCMLWLNFGGGLVVNDTLPGYTRWSAHQHDRLTISDVDNNVVWFMNAHDSLQIPAERHIQDPEWSTHPNYIACLGQVGSDVDVFDAWAIRLSDKARLKMNNGKMNSISTPHIWIADTASGGAAVATPGYDAVTGMANKNDVVTFFGTDQVKIVYTKRENGWTMYYVDYSQATPVPVQLPKPEGQETWKAESPLFSPNGQAIAFNCFEQPTLYYAYIQALSAEAEPFLIAEGASDPHWWQHPDDPSLLYIIYTVLPPNADYVVGQNLLEPELLQTGSAGYTLKQQIQLFPGRPSHAGLQLVGTPQKLINLPFRGGLSPDGKYMCTGYDYAYITILE